MDSGLTLDSDLNNLINKIQAENEEIIWEGKPEPGFTLGLFHLGGYTEGTGLPTGLVVLIAIILLFQSKYAFDAGNWSRFLTTFGIAAALIIVPEILRYLRIKHTRYVVTKTKLIFYLWHLGRRKRHIIDFLDISGITYQGYGKDKGTLHFLPIGKFDFFTYDFSSGGKRFYPTFEMVPNVVELQRQFEILRKERSNKVNRA